jgi:hypothetical protein
LLDTYTAGAAAGVGVQFGLGRLFCKDTFHVNRWVKVWCEIKGPIVSLSASLVIQVKGAAVREKCNAEELEQFHVKGNIYEVFGATGGSDDEGSANIGVSIGGRFKIPTGGAGKVDCLVTPI